jgi:hypothetical protein
MKDKRRVRRLRSGGELGKGQQGETHMSRHALTFVAALAFGFESAPAYAGPCGAEIAEIETAMSESERPVGSTNPQVRADLKVDARYIETMDRARLLDAQNSPACMKVVREIRNLIGMAAR